MDFCGIKTFKSRLDSAWKDGVDKVFDKVGDGIRWVDERYYGIPEVLSLIGVSKETSTAFLPRLLTVSEFAKKVSKIENEMYIARGDALRKATRMHEYLKSIKDDENVNIVRALDGDLAPTELSPKSFEVYKSLREIIDKNQDALVRNGLLDEGDRKEHYILRMYEKYQREQALFQKAFSKMKKRKNLSEEERIALNQIRDISVVVPHTLYKQQQQLITGVFLKNLADNLSSEEPKNGWQQVPDIRVGGKIKKFGALSGRYVPPEVLRSLNQIDELKDAVGAGLYELERVFTNSMITDVVDHIKVNLTVKNLSTHVNNIFSNMMLSFIHGDWASLASLVKMSVMDRQGFLELLEEARAYGLKTELDEITNYNEVMKEIKFDEKTGFVKGFIRGAIKNAYMAKGSYLGDKMRSFYSWEDVFFKLAAFKRLKEKGLEPSEAFREANSLYVDYTTPVPPILRAVDKTGLFPFLHYAYKATPATLRAIAKSPSSLLRFMALQAFLYQFGWSIFNDNDDHLKPEWAGGESNLFLTKQWGRVGDSDWFLNIGRFIPAMKFNTMGFFEGDGLISLGFVGALVNILNDKTPLGYNISSKYDDLTTKLTKRLLVGMETFMPPLSPFGRYGIRSVKLANGELKNYYGEEMQVDEFVARIFGVRKFNTFKESRRELTKIQNETKRLKTLLKKGKITQEEYTNQYQKQSIKNAEAYNRMMLISP